MYHLKEDKRVKTSAKLICEALNKSLKTNGQVPDGQKLQQYCMPNDEKAIKTLDEISEKLNISMRGISKIVRVARTIADLQTSDEVKEEHVLQASLFRQKIMTD